MKRSSKELKRLARDFLNNRYNVPMGAFVTASIITAVLEIPFSLSPDSFPSAPQLIISLLANYLIILIGTVLDVGIVGIHLNLTRGKEFKLSQIFAPFRQDTERYFLFAFLFCLCELLSSLPLIGGAVFFYFNDDFSVTVPILIVGGILSAVLEFLVTLHYGLVDVLLIDHPELPVLSLFRESRILMKANKGRLFFILLSLIPWLIPKLCSFGISSLWVRPYITQILVIFYMDCTGELNQLPARDYSAETNQTTDFHS